MAFGSAQYGGKNDQGKDSPWADPHTVQDPKQRVVGWRNGGGITKHEQEKILKSDREAAQQYLDSKKAIAQGRLKDIQEPLAGLPPTWQAFWSTVPGLDAQAAYRAYQREEAKREKASQVVLEKKQAEEALAGKPKPAAADESAQGGEQAVLDEIAKLETSVRQKKQALVECQHRVEAWDVKLANVRQLDREEEITAKRMKRTLDNASFKHGILRGKIMSSDNYFTFLHEDAKKTHITKMATLTRTCALMQGQIGTLKTEMRGLLKVAADQLPSHTEGDASNLGTPSALEDDRLSRGVPSSPVPSRKSPGCALSPVGTSPLLGPKSPGLPISPIPQLSPIANGKGTPKALDD